MNYIREMNAFDTLMRRSPLPPNAQLLWYKLMAYANRHYWPDWFTIDNEQLTELLGVATQTMKTARRQLIDAGLIEYKPGVKGRPGSYRLVSMAARDHTDLREERPEKELENVGDVEDITAYHGYTVDLGEECRRFAKELYDAYLPGHQPIKRDESRVFFYLMDQRNDGEQWTITFPRERKELLAYAFEAASRANAVNWNYIEGVYRNLHAQGIHTAQEAYEKDEERNRRKGW